MLSSSVYLFRLDMRDDNHVSGMLSEVYSIQGSGAIHRNVSAWYSTSGFIKRNFAHIWDRRNDLSSATVKAVAMHDPPYIYWVKPNGHDDSNPSFRGYFSGVTSFFEEKTRINMDFEFDRSGDWGGVLENGTTFGMVDMISRGQVEFGLMSFSMNKERLKGENSSML